MALTDITKSEDNKYGQKNHFFGSKIWIDWFIKIMPKKLKSIFVTNASKASSQKNFETIILNTVSVWGKQLKQSLYPPKGSIILKN